MGLRLLSGGSSSSARTRGPDGTRVPPNTPAYATAATTTGITTTAGLQTALNACTGGEVLEVTANLTAGVILASVAALASAGTKVLIRPPLGTRKTCGAVEIQCKNVVFAGFTFITGVTNAAGAGQNIAATGSYFWRCVDESAEFLWQLTTDSAETCDDMGLIECVWPRYSFNGISDRLRIGASSGGALNRRALMDGCYVASKICGIYTPASWTNAGTFSNPGQPVDFYQPGAVSVASGIAVETVDTTYAFGPPQAALMVWLDAATPDGTPTAVKLYINGVLWQTVTLDASREHRWKKVRSSIDATVNRTWTAGEVVTADVTVAGTGARGLHIMVGVDAEDGPGASGPDLHPDTLQFVSGGGSMPDFTLRDSLFGPTNGKTFQVANIDGDCVWDNCFVTRPPASSAHQFATSDAGLTKREYVIDCDFQGDQAFQTVTDRALALRNRAGSFSGTATPLDASNVVADVGPFPDPPNLAAIWPDCPYTVPAVP